MNDNIRFIQAAQRFASKAKNLPTVREVVLCGSMAAGDPYPGDIDLAVVLSNLDDLPQLARFCRQISSATHAWEVFIFNTDRKYLGRICHKRECPARYPCDALDCGKTPYLRNIRGFCFDKNLFLAPELKVLWNREEESVLLAWRKQLNLKAPSLESTNRFGSNAGNAEAGSCSKLRSRNILQNAVGMIRSVARNVGKSDGLAEWESSLRGMLRMISEQDERECIS